MEVLDLFSAAAGGWSLGMHRAGFKTIAACENVAWRRAIYQENNPDVLIYDDVCTLTADRIIRDTGRFPPVVVGSPPCQDISSANTKGKGVEGERSGLYFEAIRIIGEGRPRWFALENSSNLRTRGADAVLAALEALGYACWTFVVRAGDGKGGAGIGANHERPRSWIIGCDISQVTDASLSIPEWWDAVGGRSRRSEGTPRDGADGCDLRSVAYPHGFGRHEGRQGRWSGLNLPLPQDIGDTTQDGCGQGLSGRRACAVAGAEQSSRWNASHAGQAERRTDVVGGSDRDRKEVERPESSGGHAEHASPCNEVLADADQAGQADGCMVAGLRQAEISLDGCGSGRGDDAAGTGQMGLCQDGCRRLAGERADWSIRDLTNHLQLDDGLSTWVAGTRIAVGGPRGTSAASLIVEAFGDAVVPQIPEAIGNAIMRTERALSAIYGRSA